MNKQTSAHVFNETHISFKAKLTKVEHDNQFLIFIQDESKVSKQDLNSSEARLRHKVKNKISDIKFLSKRLHDVNEILNEAKVN